MQQEEPNKYVKELTQEKYKYGFYDRRAHRHHRAWFE